MRLDGGVRLAESRPDADVGQARVHDAVDRHRCRVDAVRRNQLVLCHHVRRRKSDGLARACVPRQSCRPQIRMAEQRARLIHAGLGDQPADAGAADDEVLVAHRIDLIGPEPVSLPQRAQQAEVAAAAVTEQKVRADPHFRDAQPLREHRAHERLGVPLRQLVGEPHHRHARDPGPVQRLEPLRLGHQQRRRLVGPHDPRRMRIERHRHRRAAVLGRPRA